SQDPLYLPFYLGAAFLAAAGVDLLWVGERAMLGRPGGLTTPVTLLAVLLTGGIGLLSQGLQGAYLGRGFEQVKGRPLYLVREQSPQLAGPQRSREAA